MTPVPRRNRGLGLAAPGKSMFSLTPISIMKNYIHSTNYRADKDKACTASEVVQSRLQGLDVTKSEKILIKVFNINGLFYPCSICGCSVIEHCR